MRGESRCLLLDCTHYNVTFLMASGGGGGGARRRAFCFTMACGGGGGVCVSRRNCCLPAGVRMNCCATGEEIGMKVWDAGKKMVPGGAGPVVHHRGKVST